MQNQALARHTDPSTSHEAAASFDPTYLESVVLEAIRKFPEGATQDDILGALPDVSHSSITPRFRPLLRKGLIEETGDKRKGKSGSRQRVMKAVN